MADHLHVMPELVETQSRLALQAADDITARLYQLASRMDSLRGSWTGPAASTYFPVWDEIDRETHEMIGDLRWIGNSLASTANAYRSMDARNAQALNDVAPPPLDPRAL